MSFFGHKPRNVKDYCVLFLSQKWPLSSSELFRLCEKHVTVSKQAVHKTLKELADQQVVVRTGTLYALNPLFVRHMHKHWETIENRLSSGQAENTGFMLGEKVVTPTAAYSFGEKELTVNQIPSVFVSHSTIQELVHGSSKKTLNAIAKFIALKDYKHIEAHVSTPSELRKNPLLAIDALNQLAHDFYWGQVSYIKKGDKIEIKIQSSVFTSPKAKRFYDRIYEHFFALLNYKKTDSNPLENSLTFSPKKRLL